MAYPDRKLQPSRIFTELKRLFLEIQFDSANLKRMISAVSTVQLAVYVPASRDALIILPAPSTCEELHSCTLQLLQKVQNRLRETTSQTSVRQPFSSGRVVVQDAYFSLYRWLLVDGAFTLMINKTLGDTEDYVSRYVILILRQVFQPATWFMVPQYYSQSRKYPDLALKTYRQSRNLFVPKVFVEFKSLVNKSPANAVKQLLESIPKENGKRFPNRGFLIGIQGRKWLFMEYAFHQEENQMKIFSFAFNAESDLLQSIEIVCKFEEDHWQGNGHYTQIDHRRFPSTDHVVE